MSYSLSRLMSAATAGYGAYALAQPDHLADALRADAADRPGLALLARTYGVRDLTISAFAVFGRSPKTVRTAMRFRFLNDVGDGVLLALRTSDPEVRSKVLAVTMGWAGLNALALTVDSLRADD